MDALLNLGADGSVFRVARRNGQIAAGRLETVILLRRRETPIPRTSTPGREETTPCRNTSPSIVARTRSGRAISGPIARTATPRWVHSAMATGPSEMPSS